MSHRSSQLPLVIRVQAGVTKHGSTPNLAAISTATATSKPSNWFAVNWSEPHFVFAARATPSSSFDWGSQSGSVAIIRVFRAIISANLSRAGVDSVLDGADRPQAASTISNTPRASSEWPVPTRNWVKCFKKFIVIDLRLNDLKNAIKLRSLYTSETTLLPA